MVSQNAEAEEMAYKGLFKGTSLFPQQVMEPATSPRFTHQGSKHGHNLRKTPSRDVSFNYGGNTINQMVQNATRRHSKSIRKTMEKMSGLQDQIDKKIKDAAALQQQDSIFSFANESELAPQRSAMVMSTQSIITQRKQEAPKPEPEVQEQQ